MVLPESPVGGIARGFQIATKSIAHLIPSFSSFLGGSGCSGDSAWTDDAKASASSIASSTRNPPKAMQ
ncbi:hypothetical protein [Bradyrhizobium sp. WSM1417]|uniref:hypothetical protein n=1 Tax=Bradyrhizobium sp. WSM1417 TaxID=754500 RepID=UPI001FDA0DFA|nr:hypothetical protein [Bradyrhizobium sp. WSM1417]